MPNLYFETDTGFKIPCPEQTAIALGRRDDANHKQIDIDFAELGENGVSRLHAIIYNTEEGVYIEDFNSRNGTFLNHYQLIPLRRYALQQKDILKVGRIELIINIGN